MLNKYLSLKRRKKMKINWKKEEKKEREKEISK